MMTVSFEASMPSVTCSAVVLAPKPDLLLPHMIQSLDNKLFPMWKSIKLYTDKRNDKSRRSQLEPSNLEIGPQIWSSATSPHCITTALLNLF